ncbi:hypothetical protein HK105_206794 [Polyrhizophydium stewartii]|uniref:Uncharacterized protein n=1 Tax=Polyrhizophydium stewartii TaxID=2732419 RepID=A0ABR4N2B3_9FUNG|nr:hypothetical protein HK105_007858 [Polyrhizophydium stewartii]
MLLSLNALLGAGLALASLARATNTHNLTIVLTADNYYDLHLAGGQRIEGPKDKSSVYGWQQIQSHTKIVSGNGPWLIAAKAQDYGVIAGFFAAVYLDGQPYTATATAGNKFRISMDTPGSGWESSASYNDAAWHTVTSDICQNVASQWGSMPAELDKLTPGLKARAMWYPDCSAVGSGSNPKTAYFRLVVSLPKVCSRSESRIPKQTYTTTAAKTSTAVAATKGAGYNGKNAATTTAYSAKTTVKASTTGYAAKTTAKAPATGYSAKTTAKASTTAYVAKTTTKASTTAYAAKTTAKASTTGYAARTTTGYAAKTTAKAVASTVNYANGKNHATPTPTPGNAYTPSKGSDASGKPKRPHRKGHGADDTIVIIRLADPFPEYELTDEERRRGHEEIIIEELLDH